MIRRKVLAATVLSLGAGVIGTAGAQDMRGAVIDSVSREPIPGAVVMLLDSVGGVLGRSITNDRGLYRLAGAPGAIQLQALRIGFRPRTVVLSSRTADGGQQADIAMLAIPTMLEPLLVRADSRCSRRPDARAAAGLWDQARAGLLATIVAREVFPGAMTRLTVERIMDRDGDAIMRQTVTVDSSGKTSTPWAASRSAAAFVSSGFADVSAGRVEFFAPDADVLFHPAFAEGYCFRIAEPVPSRPGQAGLAFAPVDRKRDRIDIDGTLWIDTVARALSDIEFRYLGLHRAFNSLRPGGRIEFREMTTGVVLIDRWSLRAVAARVLGALVPPNDALVARARLEVREMGGELARAAWPDGSSWAASLGTLRIQAVTASGQPAVGAVIRLEGTDYQGTADSSGVLEIRELLPGPYVGVLVDRRLTPLGLALNTSIRFDALRDSVARLDLTVPTAEEFVREGCLRDRQPVTEGPWFLGRVMTVDGAAIPEARWMIFEKLAGELGPVVEEGKTGAEGLFHVCSGLRPGMTVEIHLSAEAMQPAILVRELGTEGLTVMPLFGTKRRETTTTKY
jgi:hypothetical protein